MSKWPLLVVFCVVFCAGVLETNAWNKGGDRRRSRRRSMFDAQVERQHLVQKYFKKLNTQEGKLKLVGGSAENEGEDTMWWMWPGLFH